MDRPAIPGSSQHADVTSEAMSDLSTSAESAPLAMESDSDSATEPAPGTVMEDDPEIEAATAMEAATVADVLADPWSHLKDFYLLVSKSGDSKCKTYQCLLCQPVKKLIKAHSSTTSHLKLHISRQHKERLADFEVVLSLGSRRGKRPSGDVPHLAKKHSTQTNIAAWASGSGSGALQSGVDTRIVDFFVANMLSLQVQSLASCHGYYMVKL
jgi:hypothetical protein